MALHVLFVNFFVVAFSNVVTFDPQLLGKPDPTTDLLVLLDEGKSLRRNSFEQALKFLDKGSLGFKRSRSLLVTQCIGCDHLQQILGTYHLNKEDLPIAFLYPQKSAQTKQGKFGLRLKKVEQPLPSILNFIKAFDARTLTPWIRSEAEPKTPLQPSQVRHVVGSTFSNEVIDAEKHVVLLVYGDHDTSARDLQPMLAQLARLLATKPSPPKSDDGDDGDVGFQVASFNIDRNDLPPEVSLTVPKTPQLYLFRDDDKGDPDMFPPNAEYSIDNVIRWMNRMLPDQNYGLDSFFAKISKAAEVNTNEHIHEI